MSNTDTTTVSVANAAADEIERILEQSQGPAIDLDPTVIAADEPKVTPLPEVVAQNGAQAIVKHCSTAIGDVHDHTLGVLEQLEARISDLKIAVKNQRDASILKIENYVALANDSLLAAHKIDGLLGNIHMAVDKGQV